MRGWTVEQLGVPAEVMRLGNIADVPAPKAGEVVVDVQACALSFPDVLQIRGEHQDSPSVPLTPGVEYSGVVRQIGPDVSGPLAVGDRVIGIAKRPYGALAEQAISDAVDLYPIPPSLEPAAGAAMFSAFQTAWLSMIHRAELQPGQTVLVNAGAGGVGSAAIQLAVAKGARVIATAGSREKCDLCLSLGADVVINYRTDPEFAPLVKEATGGLGVDLIFDPVGGESFDQSRRCVAPEGEILVIGFAGGSIPTLKLNHPLLKNYSVTGFYLGPYRDSHPELIRQAHQEVMDLVEAGLVRPVVMETYELDRAVEVLDMLTTRQTYGRPVVVL